MGYFVFVCVLGGDSLVYSMHRMWGHAHHTMCPNELELWSWIYIHYPTLRLYKPANNQLDCVKNMAATLFFTPQRSDCPQLISVGAAHSRLSGKFRSQRIEFDKKTLKPFHHPQRFLRGLISIF